MAEMVACCPRCNGPLFAEGGDIVCLPCGWRRLDAGKVLAPLNPSGYCPKCGVGYNAAKHQRECKRQEAVA